MINNDLKRTTLCLFHHIKMEAIAAEFRPECHR